MFELEREEIFFYWQADEIFVMIVALFRISLLWRGKNCCEKNISAT